MKRVWAMVLTLAALSCATGAFAQTREDLAQYAPADEYFGPLRMSILGIRNEIHDLGAHYDNAPEDVDAILGKAVMTEACLRDWERKYPEDPALPRYVYLLSHLYQKIDHDLARRRSMETRAWLFSRYGSTSYAREEMRNLAEGSTHLQSDSASSEK